MGIVVQVNLSRFSFESILGGVQHYVGMALKFPQNMIFKLSIFAVKRVEKGFPCMATVEIANLKLN